MAKGFNIGTIKSYLLKNWRLGAQDADDTPLGITTESIELLTSEAVAKTSLDGVVAFHAQCPGIPLPSAVSDGSGGGGGGGGAMMNNEDLLKLQAQRQQFAAKQIELYSH